MDPPQSWTTNANQAVSLVFHDAGKMGRGTDRVHPEFTYPIFGEEERIQGYDNPRVTVKYAKKQPGLEESKTIESQLLPLLGKDTIQEVEAFQKYLEEKEGAFVPPGQLMHTRRYTDEKGQDRTVEYYKATYKDKGFIEYFRRLRPFSLFFIEGASYPEEEDDRWEFILAFEVIQKDEEAEGKRWATLGYVNMYPFFRYPESWRMRISQFLILPQYQGFGHGSYLYDLAMSELREHRKEISEINVEDPNEAFADMRDKRDVAFLAKNQVIQGLEAPLSREKVMKLKEQYKMNKRQLERCLEILLLRPLRTTREERRMKPYRLSVKRRLYRHNRVLKDMEAEERVEKLEETYQSVVEDYHRILESVALEDEGN
ncbi:MAG: histone acetyltransferase type B catalytic subunit [Piptocephalis tieghemiana]|nr:MAG: histone acetyltransferase type B catalytic subunit [Piptocephalis tieghemiana]